MAPELSQLIRRAGREILDSFRVLLGFKVLGFKGLRCRLVLSFSVYGPGLRVPCIGPSSFRGWGFFRWHPNFTRSYKFKVQGLGL